MIIIKNFNERILKLNNKKINFYDYYRKNACVIKFVNVSVNDIIDFFGDEIITGFKEIDSEENVIRSESFYFKPKNIFTINDFVVDREINVIKEAHYEEVKDKETGEISLIYYPAEVEVVENKVPAKITSITLESPELSDEIETVKTRLNSVKKEIKDECPALNHQDQMMKLLGFQTATLTDQQALDVAYYVPRWESGKEYVNNGNKVDRVSVETETGEIILYNCRQSHLSQANFKPGVGTESLWTRIDKEHTGDFNDPIPYHVNMEVFKDKYYIENEILYQCIQNSGQPLHNKASELVNIFFKIVG